MPDRPNHFTVRAPALIVYALTSAASSNGSAFAGLSGNTTFYNTLLAVVMLFGRYQPGQRRRPNPVNVTSPG